MVPRGTPGRQKRRPEGPQTQKDENATCSHFLWFFAQSPRPSFRVFFDPGESFLDFRGAPCLFGGPPGSRKLVRTHANFIKILSGTPFWPPGGPGIDFRPIWAPFALQFGSGSIRSFWAPSGPLLDRCSSSVLARFGPSGPLLERERERERERNRELLRKGQTRKNQGRF